MVISMAKVIQAEFDVVKWLDSEATGVDTCGTYDFCKYCKKDRVNPCQRASTIFGAVAKRKAIMALKKANK